MKRYLEFINENWETDQIIQIKEFLNENDDNSCLEILDKNIF